MAGLGNLGVSKFQIDTISRADLEHANYTDENVLINTHPETPYFDKIFQGTLDYVASHTENIYSKDTSFLQSFAKSGAVETVESNTVRWKMRGTGQLKIMSMESLMIGNPTPGLGHSSIKLKLNKRIFDVPDTIYPEHEPSLRFSVQENPVADGSGYIYTLQLHDKRATAYVPQEFLKPGIIWKKDGASFSEGSGQWGTTSFRGTSILVYESSLTNFSVQHEVTDAALQYSVRLKAMGKDGKPNDTIPDQIIGLPEATMIQDFKYNIQHTLFWGRSAGKTVLDTSTGSHRVIGEGVIEFYEDGNVTPYNRHRFTMGMFRDTFRKFFYAKVIPERANIKIRAGLGLMGLIDEALTAEFNNLPVKREYNDYVKSGTTYPGSKTPGKYLTTPTFLGFDLKPYGSITVEHLPVLDDFEMNGGRRDKKTGMPETSFWGFIEDLGIGSGNNMTLLKRKNAENYFYVCGAVGPLGYHNGGGSGSKMYGANAKRTYSVHMGDAAGVAFKDTKRTMFIHPSDRF